MKGVPLQGLLKSGIIVRGDSLYCPLALSLDSYSNCESNCVHCYFRRLNYVWDRELRPLDVENFERTLANGLKNKNPKSSLAWALKQKKTIRFGNKADPFQEAEKVYRVSKQVLQILGKYKWSFVIQTMFTGNMMDYSEEIIRMKDFCVVQPIISPGAEEDWVVLERQRTSPVQDRIDCIVFLKRKGVIVGVNGEPFISGYHTVAQFEEIVKRLKSYGVNNYNTYSFHNNAFVMRRFHAIGIDIEKIWYYNRDEQWKIILGQLIDIAKKYEVVLGSPDFVNSGRYIEKTNTCCGIETENPCTWNMITMKKKLLQGKTFEKAVEECWDGVGNYEQGIKAFRGEIKNVYSLVDAGVLGKKKGLGLKDCDL